MKSARPGAPRRRRNPIRPSGSELGRERKAERYLATGVGGGEAERAGGGSGGAAVNPVDLAHRRRWWALLI